MYNVKINGRTMPKARTTLNMVLREALDCLDNRKTFAVLVNGEWISATSDLGFGRVEFSNGRVLDGLDNDLRMNTIWR